MKKRPTDFKALFLHKILANDEATTRFIRWSFFHPLENFLNLMLSRCGIRVFSLPEKLV
jgi:hypothetical protein